MNKLHETIHELNDKIYNTKLRVIDYLLILISISWNSYLQNVSNKLILTHTFFMYIVILGKSYNIVYYYIIKLVKST